MATETRFERGEPVLVFENGNCDGVRLFFHMYDGKPRCISDDSTEDFFNGLPVETYQWEQIKKLPKPSPFRKGELVVTESGPTLFVTFFASEEYSGKIRRPTIEELNKWLPWCEIKAKE